MRTTLPILVALLLGSSLARAGGTPEGSPTAHQVRQAIGKSLPFLEKGATAWKAKGCVSCHQVPFSMWVGAEAGARGFDGNQKTLDDLANWSLDFCTGRKYESEITSGLAGAMIMSGRLLPGGEKKLKAYELFAGVLASQQLPDGSWMNWSGLYTKEPGFQIVAGPRTKREKTKKQLTAADVVAMPRTDAEKEAIAVDTMWALLSLNVLEEMGDTLPPATVRSARACRQRALEWLDRSPPGRRADWLASRMLIDHQRGKSADAERWKQALLAEQHPDGGWGLLPSDASHPFVTGQCLYALGRMGLDGRAPLIGQAWKFLLDTQRADGSWKAASRNFGMTDDVNAVTSHWSTAWADLGLLHTLPAETSKASALSHDTGRP